MKPQQTLCPQIPQAATMSNTLRLLPHVILMVGKTKLTIFSRHVPLPSTLAQFYTLPHMQPRMMEVCNLKRFWLLLFDFVCVCMCVKVIKDLGFLVEFILSVSFTYTDCIP